MTWQELLQWAIDKWVKKPPKPPAPPPPIEPPAPPPPIPPEPPPPVEPPEPPPPEPPPPGPPPPVLSDMVAPDGRTVRLLHGRGQEVASWPVAVQLSHVRTGETSQHLEYDTKAAIQRWSVIDGVYGNPWVIRWTGTEWVGATWEWLRPSQQTKGVHRGGDHGLAAHTKKSEFANWAPADGEWVGWFVSSMARDGRRNGNSRTNVVWQRW